MLFRLIYQHKAPNSGVPVWLVSVITASELHSVNLLTAGIVLGPVKCFLWIDTTWVHVVSLKSETGSRRICSTGGSLNKRPVHLCTSNPLVRGMYVFAHCWPSFVLIPLVWVYEYAKCVHAGKWGCGTRCDAIICHYSEWKVCLGMEKGLPKDACNHFRRGQRAYLG